ncbi:hypothetical protein MATL_G00133170 [Megalops atlanticus]|uniref:Fucolectin tachylectin-4 pentraxin-1 domain-containing protein n=1 Tax=Megalops atlanticus TaxID=7932 RepID=A0A9D3PYD4_MEGAT|nr:hypothetical protein MATL_G00133170 [Megalops atlanticus]
MKKVTAFLLAGVLAMAQCADPDPIPVNVALRGKATQSSTYNYMSRAAKAIDGNRDGVFSRGSCTHTEGETNPWWRLDLMDVYRVTSVTITNRVDFSERINRAEIRIGNSLKNNGNDNPLCTVILTIPPMESMTFNCSGMVGRYINVLLPGYGQFLTLCEVEVYATPATEEDIGLTPSLEPSEPIPFTENVALGKKASQSSTAFLGKADKAIDGNRNAWYKGESCSRTDKEADPWWRVDLLHAYNITSVTITNREDCCAEMIDGAEIRIGNSLENNGNSNPLCAVISSFPVWETLTFQCGDMEGRYVNIFLPGCQKYLNLCEVEVNARTIPVSQSSSPPAIQTENPLLELSERVPVKDEHKSKQCSDTTIVLENAASGRKATQSTQWDYLGDANNAIDRDWNSDYMSGSCSHTKAETDPWWRVDLLKPHNVTSVAVTNREDCCSERINGAEIHIGNSLKNNGNDNPVCAVIPYIPAGQTRTYQCHGIEGRYINIILPGREKYLTLCEVEIYGTAIDDAISILGGEMTPLIKGRGSYLSWFMDGISRGSPEENVALMGIATQSSQFDHLTHAKNAIDGLRNAAYSSGSCTHTKLQTDPWWRVDLQRTYRVTSVSITNRGDCCHERINGAEIRIGNSMENNGNNNPVCAVVSAIPAGESVTFECHGMEGRYVNVIRPGCYKFLTLCEVEVNASPVPVLESTPSSAIEIESDHMEVDPVTYGGGRQRETQCPLTAPENAASGGKATQSSTGWSGHADRAIDRNRNPVYHSRSCTHTAAENDPWWRVDLLKNHRVTSVTVTNRGDCCHDRLDGAEIRIGNSLDNNGNDNPVCAVISHIREGDSVTFQCNEMEGRYVNVFLPGREKYLTLCEVEVNGSAVPDEILPTPSNGFKKPRRRLKNVALRGRATQSSQASGSAFDAIDGNRNSNYNDGSCTHTELQTDPWWRVDLRREYRVTSVSITNRGDCCHERINGAEIRIGNSMENNGNNNSVCAVVSSIPAGGTMTVPCKEMEGRYVSIVLPGREKYLTLCEVEVHGVAVRSRRKELGRHLIEKLKRGRLDFIVKMPWLWQPKRSKQRS